MSDNDPTPPVADDDFPEFADPPQHRPRHVGEPQTESSTTGDGVQGDVDEVLERLRRQREQGER
jgi:hypothetical protein